ncbi:MAG: DUF5615 family PIN-like protein [Lewinellaceae bacterium]|nr:DUF5615 family PIN-like protein [Lewinellaceae bacterium]
MTLRDFKLMVDENISPEVTDMLRKEGFDVFSVEESEFVGNTDRQLIRWLSLPKESFLLTTAILECWQSARASRISALYI